MDEDETVQAVHNRARGAASRTDYKNERHGSLPAPATTEAIREAENRLGFRLHPLHRRLLLEVADGGFGPGDGIVGVGSEGSDAHGRTMIELRDALGLDGETPLPIGVVPICDWGDGIWSCVDVKTGHVLTLSEFGLTDTELDFQSWLAEWAAGESLMTKMFAFEERTIINPFTKRPLTVQRPARAIGTPYKPRTR